MGESQGAAGEAVGSDGDRTPEQVQDPTPEQVQDPTPEQVQEEIERTRAELGETVAELAAKTDVKARARRAVDNAKVTAVSKAEEVREIAPREVATKAKDHRMALMGIAAVGAALLIWRVRS